MKRNETVRRRLAKELVLAQENVNKYVSRPGIHYSWYPAAEFNAEIQYKRDFAVRWRRQALALKGLLDERKERVYCSNFDIASRSYRVYSVAGVDMLAVCPKLGSNSLCRMVDLSALGLSFEEWISQRMQPWKQGNL